MIYCWFLRGFLCSPPFRCRSGRQATSKRRSLDGQFYSDETRILDILDPFHWEENSNLKTEVLAFYPLSLHFQIKCVRNKDGKSKLLLCNLICSRADLKSILRKSEISNHDLLKHYDIETCDQWIERTKLFEIFQSFWQKKVNNEFRFPSKQPQVKLLDEAWLS